MVVFVTTTTADNKQDPYTRLISLSLFSNTHHHLSLTMAENPKIEVSCMTRDMDILHLNLCKDRLQEALDVDSVGGTYHYEENIEDAFNPLLCLDGLGSIGLPLSENDARRLRDLLAPPGEGKQRFIDKSACNTWEIDATKARYS